MLALRSIRKHRVVIRACELPFAAALVIVEIDGRIHSRHVHLLAVHGPRLERQRTALRVQRKPSNVHATVRRQVPDGGPPETRPVRTDHSVLRLQIVLIVFTLSRTAMHFTHLSQRLPIYNLTVNKTRSPEHRKVRSGNKTLKL